MRLSNMADYAVVVMGAAARHCGGARTSATALADETGIALPTVQKVVCSGRFAGRVAESSFHDRLLRLPLPILSRPLKDPLR
jgi:hypothetical protein